MLTINNAFNFGQIVYLKADPDALARIVTGIKVRPGNAILYTLACAEQESTHYELEITDDKTLYITINPN